MLDPYIALDLEKHDLSSKGHLTKTLFCCFLYFYIKINTFQGVLYSYVSNIDPSYSKCPALDITPYISGMVSKQCPHLRMLRFRVTPGSTPHICYTTDGVSPVVTRSLCVLRCGHRADIRLYCNLN
jgi:hypothetical protein